MAFQSERETQRRLKATPASPGVASAMPARRSRRPTAASFRRVAIAVAATDALGFAIGAALARFIRGDGLHGSQPLLPIILLPALGVAVFAVFHAYAIGRLGAAEEMRRVLNAGFVVLALRLLVPLFIGVDRFSRPWLLLSWALGLGAVLGFRQAWRKFLARERKRGRFRYRTLVVGANDEAIRLARALSDVSSTYMPVGMVTTTAEPEGGLSPVPILGPVRNVSAIVEAADIECVFLTTSAIDPQQLKSLMTVLRRKDVEMRVSANVTDILASRLTVEPVGDLLTLSLKPVRLTGPQAAMKRVFDVVVASLLLVVGAPLFAAIALMIRVTSTGPILYTQDRIARNGRTFRLLKFRTMVDGAERMLPELLDLPTADRLLFKIRDDPRLTRVGSFLRRRSLDELPQLVNVIAGSMSLVGPRPALGSEVKLYEDWHRDRLEVRPGMTGLWQVRGRSDLPFDDAVRLDLFYIENWSLAFDLYLLYRTIGAVLRARGAY